MAKKEKTTPPETEAENKEETAQAAAAADSAEAEETVQPAEEAQSESVLKLQEQLAAANDKFLRLAAEYDNYRKRTAKEKEDLNAQCKSSVIGTLLPVMDNLERALADETENLEEYRKGVRMIGDQFYAALDKLHVEAFGEAGDAFDPNFHNAVMHIEDDNLEENVIAAVFSKGYRMGERIIRPAMVQVAN